MRGAGFTDPNYIKERIGAITDRVGCDVGLSWQTLAGGTYDPISQSTIGATPTPATANVRATLHFLQIGSYVVREFAEVEAGDCIADFAPDVALDDKENLVFTINGEKWSHKPMSDELAKYWDTIIGDTQLTRTVLLRKL